MRKIVITGSNGLLGQSLLDLLVPNSNYQVTAISRGENRYPISEGYSYHSIELTNKTQVTEIITTIAPDYIINTAAMTNVDACEDNKEECYEINVSLVENLINISEKINAHLIHISTDFIFDGNSGPYSEDAQPNPLSYYGETKLLSEQRLLKSNIKFTILRTILVYGKVHDMSRNNIVLWVKKMLEDKKEITIVDDQYRMPTYVEDLALACKQAIDLNEIGVFNVSSNTLLSIYEIAHQIASVFNLDASYIKPIPTSILNQKAKRPPKTGFILDKTSEVLQLKFNSFKEDLHRFKEKLT